MPSDLIAQAAYARRIGISAQLLAHHIKVGNVAVHGEHRKISIAEADAALRDIVKPANIPNATRVASSGKAAAGGARLAPSEGVPLTLHEARAERARQDAARSALAREKERIELDLLRGSVVALSEVEREWAAALTILRSRLIAIPSKVAARIAATSDPAVARDILDEEIRFALDELSKGSATAG
jgi:hypothetical protein